MAWIVSANWSPSCTAGSESLPHLATALDLATAMAAKVSVTSPVSGMEFCMRCVFPDPGQMILGRTGNPRALSEKGSAGCRHETGLSLSPPATPALCFRPTYLGLGLRAGCKDMAVALDLVLRVKHMKLSAHG